MIHCDMPVPVFPQLTFYIDLYPFTTDYVPNHAAIADGRMRTVLMVAEKPSLAQSIANILSHRKATSRKGSNNSCSVFEWADSFPPTGEKVKYKMTSVCGHVMSLDFLAKFNSWDK